MNITKIRISFVCILVFFILSPQKQIHAAGDCPADTDTKIYVNATDNLCYSGSDPNGSNQGFNTQGGTPNAACQVLCPGATGTSPQGHDCVVEMNGQCFAGTGPSGFNTPGCTPASTTALAQCPPNTMPLTTLVVDNGNPPKGIGNVALNITFADAPPAAGGGQTVTTYTDMTGTGTTTGILHSGDHFIITPSLPGYTFSPTQIGGATNIGDQEMNTNFSCGQTPQTPCKFTATPGQGTAVPPGAVPPATQNAAGAPIYSGTQPSDNTVSNEMHATEKAAGVVAGIVFVAVFIQELLGLGKGKAKKEI